MKTIIPVKFEVVDALAILSEAAGLGVHFTAFETAEIAINRMVATDRGTDPLLKDLIEFSDYHLRASR